MMRPVLLIIFLAPLLLGFQPQRTRKHTNDAQRWAVTMPVDWEVQEGVEASTTLLVAPQEGDLDIFRENVAVLVREQEAAVTLEQARDALKKEMTAQGAKLIDSDDKSKLAGRPAHRFVWSFRLAGFDLSLTQLIIAEADRIYVLTFSVERGHEHRYAGVATAIGNSFVILPASSTRPVP